MVLPAFFRDARRTFERGAAAAATGGASVGTSTRAKMTAPYEDLSWSAARLLLEHPQVKGAAAADMAVAAFRWALRRGRTPIRTETTRTTATTTTPTKMTTTTTTTTTPLGWLSLARLRSHIVPFDGAALMIPSKRNPELCPRCSRVMCANFAARCVVVRRCLPARLNGVAESLGAAALARHRDAVLGARLRLWGRHAGQTATKDTPNTAVVARPSIFSPRVRAHYLATLRAATRGGSEPAEQTVVFTPPAVRSWTMAR